MGVNKPLLVNSYSEAVTQIGQSKKWEDYTLSEAVYSEFALYQVYPAIYINVLDPAKHKKTETNVNVTLTDNTGIIEKPVLLNTLVVRKTQAAEPLQIDKDYTATYNDDEQLVISMTAPAASVVATYDYLDPSMVTEDDIIGGVASDGSLKA